MLEAVNHPTLYLKSALDVSNVFEHFHMLWMGVWVHPFTVTPGQDRWGPNYGNLGV
jgi:hypothetical protein